MNLLLRLSSVALRTAFGPGADSPIVFLSNRFTDRSTLLLEALRLANWHAWKAIEVALSGDGWWQRVRRTFKDGDVKGFHAQVQGFIAALPSAEKVGLSPSDQASALSELRAARKAKLLPGDRMPTAAELADSTQALLTHSDPQKLLAAETKALGEVGDELAREGYAALARFVRLRPGGGEPLLAVAVKYFFRREVEANPVLAQQLTFQTLEGITAAQEQGFAGLRDVLTQHGDKLDAMLGEILDEVRAVGEVARDTLDATLDNHAELLAMRRQMDAMMAILTRFAPSVFPPINADEPLLHAQALLDRTSQVIAAKPQAAPELVAVASGLQHAVTTYSSKTGLRAALPNQLFMAPVPQPAPLPKPGPVAAEARKPGLFAGVPKPKLR